jgi:hypothetical protein
LVSLLPSPSSGGGSPEPGGSDSIVPFSENSHRPSLRRPPVTPPPAMPARYCALSCWNVVAVVVKPPSV